MRNLSDQDGKAGFTNSKNQLLQFLLINFIRSYHSVIFSDHKSLRSSIILLLIKCPDKYIYIYICLKQPLTARSFSEIFLRKTVLVNEEDIPRPFLIHNSTYERLAKSHNHSFKQYFDLESYHQR